VVLARVLVLLSFILFAVSVREHDAPSYWEPGGGSLILVARPREMLIDSSRKGSMDVAEDIVLVHQVMKNWLGHVRHGDESQPDMRGPRAARYLPVTVERRLAPSWRPPCQLVQAEPRPHHNSEDPGYAQ
jgi:hypothetical protein